MSSRIIFLTFLLGAMLAVNANAQLQAPPTPSKTITLQKLNEIGIADIWNPDAHSFGVQIATHHPTPPFTVKIWVQYKGSTARRFYEKRVPAFSNTVTNIEVVFNGLGHLLGAEIGIFPDSKNEILEKEEKNCARVTAKDEWILNLPCTNFGKEK